MSKTFHALAEQDRKTVHALQLDPLNAKETEKNYSCVRCGKTVEIDPQGRGFDHPGACIDPDWVITEDNRRQNLALLLQKKVQLQLLTETIEVEKTGGEKSPPQVLLKNQDSTEEIQGALLLPGDEAPEGSVAIQLDPESLDLPRPELRELVREQETSEQKTEESSPEEKARAAHELEEAIERFEAASLAVARENVRNKWRLGLQNYPVINRFGHHHLIDRLVESEQNLKRSVEHAKKAGVQVTRKQQGDVQRAEQQAGDLDELRRAWEQKREHNEAALKVEVSNPKKGGNCPLGQVIRPIVGNKGNSTALDYARGVKAVQEALQQEHPENIATELRRVIHGLYQLSGNYRISASEINKAVEEEQNENEEEQNTAKEDQKTNRQSEKDAESQEEEERVSILLDQLEAAGYQRRTVLATWSALRCTRMAILTGPSGSGKSSLLESLAEHCRWRWHLISVHPAWASGEELIAMPGILDAEVISGPLGEAISAALHDPGHLHLAVLDEMNLAIPEHIMSDLISVLEVKDPTRRKIRVCSAELASRQPETLLGQVIKTHEGYLPWPENLLLAGTANDDETTQLLSDRLRDRAGVIRLEAPQDLDHLIKSMQGPRRQEKKEEENAAITPRHLEKWDKALQNKGMDAWAAELLGQLGRRLGEIDPELLSLRSGQSLLEVARLQAEIQSEGTAREDADLACAMTMAQRGAARARQDQDKERLSQLRQLFEEFFGADSMSVHACS